MVITDKTDNEDYHSIKIQNFASIEQVNVNLKISIRCSEEQTVEGLLPEFMGAYQRRGNYVSRQGYKVSFVGDKTLPAQSVNEDTVHGEIIGFFVADGILYRVSGEMSVNQMKEFIDSLT